MSRFNNNFVIVAGPIPLRVREAELPVVSDAECIRKVNAVTEKIFILPASSFCAGGEEGNDACQGDGGKISSFSFSFFDELPKKNKSIQQVVHWFVKTMVSLNWPVWCHGASDVVELMSQVFMLKFHRSSDGLIKSSA